MRRKLPTEPQKLPMDLPRHPMKPQKLPMDLPKHPADRPEVPTRPPQAAHLRLHDGKGRQTTLHHVKKRSRPVPAMPAGRQTKGGKKAFPGTGNRLSVSFHRIKAALGKDLAKILRLFAPLSAHLHYLCFPKTERPLPPTPRPDGRPWHGNAPTKRKQPCAHCCSTPRNKREAPP